MMERLPFCSRLPCHPQSLALSFGIRNKVIYQVSLFILTFISWFLMIINCIFTEAVLATTEAGELLMTSFTESAPRPFPPTGTLLASSQGGISKPSDKIVAALPKGLSFKAVTSPADVVNKRASYDPLRQGWLGEFFDESTGSIPAVSSIYGEPFSNCYFQLYSHLYS